MTNAKAIVVEIPKELERKELNETLSKGRVSGREQDCYEICERFAQIFLRSCSRITKA